VNSKSQRKMWAAALAPVLWTTKFVWKPVRVQVAGLLLGAALLTAPMAAQQEVSPEHFDAKPAASQTRKAPRRPPAPTARSRQAAGVRRASPANQKLALRKTNATEKL
jgi:hypothetical protein